MVDSQQLKGKIIAAGLTQRKLAKIVGMGITSLGKKINGQSDFTLSEVQRICSAIGIESNEEKCNIFLARSSQ